MSLNRRVINYKCSRGTEKEKNIPTSNYSKKKEINNETSLFTVMSPF